MKCLEKLSEKQAKRITVVLLILGIALLACTAILTIGSGKGYEVTTYSMGSYVRQTVYGKEREEAARQAANAVAGLEDLISWRVEDSDIQKLNAQAGKEFIPVESQTWQLLKLSLSVCEASSGAFDITIAPLSQLWDFDDNPHLPKPSLIKAMLPQVDYSTLSLLEDGTAALRNSGTAVDLGAVGKGAACDAAVEIYRQNGVDRAIIAVGGSVGLFGEKPFGEPWKITVRNPENTGGMGELRLQEGFVSTSGSYEKTFTDEDTGKVYHHLLDPKTGYPAESGLVSVTVWGKSGALSDALSTACFVLGLEDSLPLLKEFGAGAVFLTEEHQVYVTENLAEAFSVSSSEYTFAGVV